MVTRNSIIIARREFYFSLFSILLLVIILMCILIPVFSVVFVALVLSGLKANSIPYSPPRWVYREYFMESAGVRYLRTSC